MFNENGMLTDRARGILFWFTLVVIIAIAVIAVVTILRACQGLVAEVEPPPPITPTAASLCTGQQQQFSIEGDVEVEWEATGGTVTQSGLYTAGDIAGEFSVLAQDRNSSQVSEATVQIIACTPTPTQALPTATPQPTATPTPEATAPETADPQGDVSTYEGGTPVENAPIYVDISGANISADLHIALNPTEGVPDELAGWATETDALLWISLHGAIPSPPTIYTDWLFALDLDGDTTTGRQPGAARINPDLGDDAVVGVSYNPATAAFEPYLLLWDGTQGQWRTTQTEVRYIVTTERTVLGLAVPMEALQAGDVSIAPETVQARAAAFTYQGEQRVIDFYPDRP